VNILKKSLLASAVSMALVGSAQAGFVRFDFNGGGHTFGTDTFDVKSFKWNSGNMAILNVAPMSGSIPSPTTVVAQAVLGNLLLTDNTSKSLTSGQITYQMTTYMTFDGINFDPPGAPPATSFFEMFWNPTLIASDLTGCGYGTHQSAFCGGSAGFLSTGKLIYSGSAVLATSNVVLNQPGTPAITILDQTVDSIDNSNGVTTDTIKFDKFLVNVNTDETKLDLSFFLTNIATQVIDIIHTEFGSGSPFEGSAANPSDEVVGVVTKRAPADVTAFFGSDSRNNIDGLSCPPGGGIVDPGSGERLCGVQLSSSAESGVNDFPIPEPATLALLGLGLAGLGAGAGRRRRRI